MTIQKIREWIDERKKIARKNRMKFTPEQQKAAKRAQEVFRRAWDGAPTTSDNAERDREIIAEIQAIIDDPLGPQLDRIALNKLIDRISDEEE